MITDNRLISDPLLSGGRSYDECMREVEAQLKRTEERKRALQELASRQPGETIAGDGTQGRTPIWDEIDRITQGMSEKEFAIMANNDEFKESQAAVMAVLQAQYMRMMRPMVEGCKQGKAALELHLTLVKRLRTVAATEANRELDDFNEYKTKYANIPYSDYLEMKKEGKI